MAVITVGAEKGGVGKTRLSTHIAAIAAREGVDVVLLDTDKQGSAISWSRIRGEDEDQTLKKFPVLALPPNPAKEVQNLSSKYDLVVVDIGGTGTSPRPETGPRRTIDLDEGDFHRDEPR